MTSTLLKLVLLGSLLLTSAVGANTAVEPAPRDGQWLERHAAMSERAQEGEIDLLFLGDSITDFWDKRAVEVWTNAFGRYRTANFGISGDRTEHLLWRLQNGEGEGFQPEVVVLMIGTNNTGLEGDGTPRNSTEEVIEGVTAVVKEVRFRFPKATLLLFGPLPRAEKDHPQRTQVAEINAAIRKLEDAKHIIYFDIGASFLDSEGHIVKDLMPDLLHPSPAGYEIWAEALEKPLALLLRD